jgi:hypothetical protein
MIDIYIFAFNRPDLLELQIDCLKKFLLNDFAIHVVHDSRNGENSEEFIEAHNELKKKYKDLEINYLPHRSPEVLSSSQYHAKVLQWTYDSLIKPESDKICLFLDHDIFPIDTLNLLDDLRDCDIIALEQDRNGVKYIWPGLVLFRSSKFKEIDWNCGVYYDQLLDTGGGTSKLLRDDSVIYKNYEVSYPDSYNDYNLKNTEVTFGYNFELHYGQKFLHSRNACNWDTSYNIRDLNKTELLVTIIQDILNG